MYSGTHSTGKLARADCRANGMAVRYRILNPTPWISNSESYEERAVSKRHNAMLTLYNYKIFAV